MRSSFFLVSSGIDHVYEGRCGGQMPITSCKAFVEGKSCIAKRGKKNLGNE